ncbi:hypothetical protein YC2023_008128 [Brassica napus]
MDLRSNPFQEGGNDVPWGSAPGKTDIHGLIMESSKDICSFIGLDGFQKKIQKRACLDQMEKPIKYWLREKMDFDQASKGHVLDHIRSIFFTFQSLGRGYMKR